MNMQLSQNSFEEEQLGRSPRGFHKTEMDYMDFIQTFASVKSQKYNLYINCYKK
jgi:uncharacterized protein (DUF2461 family)